MNTLKNTFNKLVHQGLKAFTYAPFTMTSIAVTFICGAPVISSLPALIIIFGSADICNFENGKNARSFLKDKHTEKTSRKLNS